MLPSKWTYTFDKPTDTIHWVNGDHTFKANCCFPAPRHNYLPYFEIFVTGRSAEQPSTVAIGLAGLDTPEGGQLPGWNPGSYGYHADDGKVFLEDGESGKLYGPTYTTGDVVGCGITIDNELYFTKNGKHLGIACVLPAAKFFPAVGLDHASISTNFGKDQFMYDPLTRTYGAPPVISEPTELSLLTVTPEIKLNILSFMNVQELSTFGMVNKENYRTTRHNELWKPLVVRKWPTVTPASPDYPVSSFYEFYKKRVWKLGLSKFPKNVIENCAEWEFQCPVAIDKLTRTADAKVDFCSVCDKHVYLVQNVDQLMQRVDAKQCVVIDFDDSLAKSRVPIPRRRTGGVMIRRKVPPFS